MDCYQIHETVIRDIADVVSDVHKSVENAGGIAGILNRNNPPTCMGCCRVSNERKIKSIGCNGRIISVCLTANVQPLFYECWFFRIIRLSFEYSAF